ncbi:NAD(P)-binding domain-containing protein [Bacillus suaedaesalsae]|uniref:NAD(P)-binding domain-containing protein n=1 Tax=Bacillus suaedaesalsae TaxID=2810349 RepID=A0ABS2DHR0_9BACI|nr:NAD(P)-binding domain-containing protein [Bacillus suaedaesalsae]MBM6617068.1 NAD(P)-binding domain-containing protein [Bacillus suaedaesalsae]
MLYTLPIIIIGAGPVGLAAAAHLVRKGESFIILESGKEIGANVLEWGHVKMFSPWQYNIDIASRELLEKAAWNSPGNEELPTGNELVNDYLIPLSQLPQIKENLLLNAKVVGITRKGIDKLKNQNRESVPFQVYVEVGDEINVFEARAIIDASGTWKNPNPSLSNGLWTTPERNLKGKIHYGIPNVREMEQRYANKTIMVVGSGHSAINTILDMAELKEKYPNTAIYWVLRKTNVAAVYGGQENDQLPARGELGIRIQKVVESEKINVLTPFYISQLLKEGSHIKVYGELNGKEFSISNVDEMIVSTGFRPDTSFLDEVRLNLDEAVESVKAIAPLIDPNFHSCGTVRPHGEAELRQSEKDFYVVGMKSYGRAPTFLLATGYEQVRSIVAYMTGDEKGAKEVQLELPETGVCSTGIINKSAANNSCCGSSESKIEIITSSCCS